MTDQTNSKRITTTISKIDEANLSKFPVVHLYTDDALALANAYRLLLIEASELKAEVERLSEYEPPIPDEPDFEGLI